ncbi:MULTISPECIES: hypothetical protein [Enterococcus]|uniref:Uncharacterized protein n=1 Tax=Candidatus Enterococcus mangumiae TaxID=2230878 RepID=A0ABZ2SZE5_9ENTE|nr:MULTISPECIES: hypothetical protein [unclassified Enterococcus]MBO0462570.1 hypothetical protein [Enterococcus sp. DIV1298c]MBO0490569.1 hypothetical protein [Enterococcus sp. DIV1094]MBO1301126.1 hypothetical protein [Enterococcus sp. DIV1271a]
MLNIYFVFGVPAFLLILYLLFALIRKRTSIHYLGFILLIIAGFMLVFNLQTWQQALTELAHTSSTELSAELGYSVYLIWVPITIAGCLVLLNVIRAWLRIQQLRKKER